MNVFKYLDNQDKADILLFLQYFYNDYVLKYEPNFCLRKRLETLLAKFQNNCM